MTVPAERPPRIAFLLGKPVPASSALAGALDRLRALPATVTIHHPGGEAPPLSLFDADLIVQRGLPMPALEAALALERAGIRCCNGIAATIAVKDRARSVQTLAGAGVPVPTTVPVDAWPALRDKTAGRPVVVKTAAERTGRGRGVLVAARGDLPPEAPFEGPYVAQDYVPNDGMVHKVYVAGRQAAGLLKRQSADGPAAAFAPDPGLIALSLRVGAALGLEIYGVDVLSGPDGPVVIDVNPFPGFRGVPDAARLIADHLTALATGRNED
jgi:ribosomal protein S6--L-glutamate ligase